MPKECGHTDSEDCMFCSECGECREDLDENDVCSDCQGSECYYKTPQCEGPLWTCETCGETFCEVHFHETDKGRNTECVACERQRKDQPMSNAVEDLCFNDVVARLTEKVQAMNGEELADLWNHEFDGTLTYLGDSQFALEP